MDCGGDKRTQQLSEVRFAGCQQAQVRDRRPRVSALRPQESHPAPSHHLSTRLYGCTTSTASTPLSLHVLLGDHDALLDREPNAPWQEACMLRPRSAKVAMPPVTLPSQHRSPQPAPALQRPITRPRQSRRPPITSIINTWQGEFEDEGMTSLRPLVLAALADPDPQCALNNTATPQVLTRRHSLTPTRCSEHRNIWYTLRDIIQQHEIRGVYSSVAWAAGAAAAATSAGSTSSSSSGSSSLLCTQSSRRFLAAS